MKSTTTYIDPTDTPSQVNAKCQAAASIGGVVEFPAGTFQATKIELTDVAGFTMRGASRNSTFLIAANGEPALKINGLWFSRIENIGFYTAHPISDGAVVEIDGNYDGTNTRRVQGNTFADIRVNGSAQNEPALSKFGMSLNRYGGNAAQGSENNFLNCHFGGATQAAYYQNGFNALNNQFIGGNCSDYSKHGIEIIGGSIHVLGMGFQSTYGYAQVDNDGWDISACEKGAVDPISIIGCRSESFRFYKGSWSQPPHLMNCTQRYGVALDPAKPPLVSVMSDEGLLTNCVFSGIVDIRRNPDGKVKSVTSDYALAASDRIIYAHSKYQDISLSLFHPQKITEGVTIRVIKHPDNTVTINGGWINGVPGSVVLTGTDTATFISGSEKKSTQWYYRV